MTCAKQFMAMGLTGVIMLGVGLMAASSGATETEVKGAQTAPTREVRVRPGHLLHDSGAELYAELCASCHGDSGDGSGPAVAENAAPAPALNRLKRDGVPRRHWIYVLESPCEDRHHGQPDGLERMPCWSRLLRQALGSDASVLLVSKKLIDHLDSIQQ